MSTVSTAGTPSFHFSERSKRLCVELIQADVDITFRFISPDVINITYSAAVAHGQDERVYDTLPKCPEVRIRENRDTITASCGDLYLVILKNPFSYEIRRESRILLKQAVDDKDIVGNRYTDLMKFETRDSRVVSIRDSFSVTHDEKFYGFGEKFSPINKRGLNIEAWNCDAMGVGSDKAYKNIPFFLNSNNYGIHINTASRICYSLATESFDAYSITVEDEVLDLYFISGDSFKGIISRYMDLTGRMEALPPKWSFGLWMGRYGYTSRKQIEEIGQKLRERK
ncbi:MAG: hypothetical protein HN368_18870, partial [Spirochaetales bacterium]|nr:hypothetical protein [Spirochaetales bacterium]